MLVKGETDHVPPSFSHTSATSWPRNAYIACRYNLLAMDADGLSIKRAFLCQRQNDLYADLSLPLLVGRGHLLLFQASRTYKCCRSLNNQHRAKFDCSAPAALRTVSGMRRPPSQPPHPRQTNR